MVSSVENRNAQDRTGLREDGALNGSHVDSVMWEGHTGRGPSGKGTPRQKPMSKNEMETEQKRAVLKQSSRDHADHEACENTHSSFLGEAAGGRGARK